MTKRFNPPSAHRVSAVAIAAALAAFASVAGAQSTQPRDSPRAAAASAAAGATGAPAAARALPGYAQSSNGQVVLNGFGTCVRSGHWAPQHAAEPCDRIAVARLEPPPVPVAAAPEPKLEPAPAPVPAPLAVVEPPRPVIQRITLSADVLFEFAKAQLRDTGKQKLDEIASATKDARVEEVFAIGYADPIGSEQYNEKLSAARAAAEREYLVQKGVSPERIKSEGRGETREFSAGTCAKLTGRKLIDCFEPNRRVDVELLGSREVAAGSPAAGSGATGTR